MQQWALFERKKMKSPSIKNYLNQISFKLTTREEFIISPWRGVGFSTSKNKIEYILYRRILQMGHVWYKLTEERASLHLSFSYETTSVTVFIFYFTILDIQHLETVGAHVRCFHPITSWHACVRLVYLIKESECFKF